jgi:hypothetical protein
MFNAKKMDLESLDELISKCEDAMVHPFKKKKAVVAVEVKPGDEGSDQEEKAESPEEEVAEDDAKPDLSDMDMEDLLKLYEEIKGSKA